MNFIAVGSLALLGLLSHLPASSYGAALEYPGETVGPKVYQSLQGRIRRSPQPSTQAPEVQTIPGLKLSGEGGRDNGYVRLDGEKEIFNNDKTRVDAKAFAARSWYPGGAENSYGAGATVSQRVWEKNGQSLDVYGGYRREFNTPDKHNFGGGLIYRFR